MWTHNLPSLSRTSSAERLLSDLLRFLFFIDIFVRCHLLVVFWLSYWTKFHIDLDLFTLGWLVLATAKNSPSTLLVFQSLGFAVYSVSITLAISIRLHQDLDTYKCRHFKEAQLSSIACTSRYLLSFSLLFGATGELCFNNTVYGMVTLNYKNSHHFWMADRTRYTVGAL